MIRSAPRPACPMCGGAGAPLHARLHDRLFGADGEWTLARCSNDDCGHLWLDPAPLEEDLPLAYGRYYTHAAAAPPARGTLVQAVVEAAKQGHLARRLGYPASPWAKFASLLLVPFETRRESLEQLVFHLPAIPGGRVLEVGCGAGDSLAALRAHGWDVEGIDFDAAAVAAARARGLPAGQGSLVGRGGPADAYDAVVMAHVIEHVPDPVALVKEARRILKPGGRLVSVTPNANGAGHRAFGRAWRGLEPPRHLHVFAPGSLRRAAVAGGFGTPELRSSARMAAYLSAQSRSLAAGRVVLEYPPLDTVDFAFQAEERRKLRTDPWAGEELILVAQKDA